MPGLGCEDPESVTCLVSTQEFVWSACNDDDHLSISDHEEPHDLSASTQECIATFARMIISDFEPRTVVQLRMGSFDWGSVAVAVLGEV